MKKGIKIFSLILTVVLLAGMLCGCSVTEEEYKTQMQEQVRTFEEGKKKFSEKFGELGFGDDEWVAEMEGMINDMSKQADTMRKIKAPENYSETQEKTKEASKKIKESMGSYKELIFDIQNNSDLFKKESELNTANERMQEASKLLEEVKKDLK